MHKRTNLYNKKRPSLSSAKKKNEEVHATFKQREIRDAIKGLELGIEEKERNLQDQVSHLNIAFKKNAFSLEEIEELKQQVINLEKQCASILVDSNKITEKTKQLQHLKLKPYDRQFEEAVNALYSSSDAIGNDDEKSDLKDRFIALKKLMDNVSVCDFYSHEAPQGKISLTHALYKQEKLDERMASLLIESNKEKVPPECERVSGENKLSRQANLLEIAENCYLYTLKDPNEYFKARIKKSFANVDYSEEVFKEEALIIKKIIFVDGNFPSAWKETLSPEDLQKLTEAIDVKLNELDLKVSVPALSPQEEENLILKQKQIDKDQQWKKKVFELEKKSKDKPQLSFIPLTSLPVLEPSGSNSEEKVSRLPEYYGQDATKLMQKGLSTLKPANDQLIAREKAKFYYPLPDPLKQATHALQEQQQHDYNADYIPDPLSFKKEVDRKFESYQKACKVEKECTLENKELIKAYFKKRNLDLKKELIDEKKTIERDNVRKISMATTRKQKQTLKKEQLAELRILNTKFVEKKQALQLCKSIFLIPNELKGIRIRAPVQVDYDGKETENKKYLLEIDRSSNAFKDFEAFKDLNSTKDNEKTYAPPKNRLAGSLFNTSYSDSDSDSELEALQSKKGNKVAQAVGNAFCRIID